MYGEGRGGEGTQVMEEEPEEGRVEGTVKGEKRRVVGEWKGEEEGEGSQGEGREKRRVNGSPAKEEPRETVAVGSGTWDLLQHGAHKGGSESRWAALKR